MLNGNLSFTNSEAVFAASATIFYQFFYERQRKIHLFVDLYNWISIFCPILLPIKCNRWKIEWLENVLYFHI